MEKITIEMELDQVEKIIKEEMKWNILNPVCIESKKQLKALKGVLKMYTSTQEYTEFKRVAKARGLW